MGMLGWVGSGLIRRLTMIIIGRGRVGLWREEIDIEGGKVNWFVLMVSYGGFGDYVMKVTLNALPRAEEEGFKSLFDMFGRKPFKLSYLLG